MLDKHVRDHLGRQLKALLDKMKIEPGNLLPSSRKPSETAEEPDSKPDERKRA